MCVADSKWRWWFMSFWILIFSFQKAYQKKTLHLPCTPPSSSGGLTQGLSLRWRASQKSWRTRWMSTAGGSSTAPIPGSLKCPAPPEDEQRKSTLYIIYMYIHTYIWIISRNWPPQSTYWHLWLASTIQSCQEVALWWGRQPIFYQDKVLGEFAWWIKW